MRRALGADCRVTASGRTDAGVHAAGQICHFDAEGLTVPPGRLPDCINPFLPPAIRVLAGGAAEENFDCSRRAKRKTYCYSLYVSEREMPLKERYAVRLESAPELAALQSAAKLFEGEHDFKAFCASGSSVWTFACLRCAISTRSRLKLPRARARQRCCRTLSSTGKPSVRTATSSGL